MMLDKYTDIHSHSLWGIDDGARDLEDAVELCAIAADRGTGVLFLTPHLMYWENADALMDERDEKVEELKEILEEEGIEIELKKGFEILCDDEIFQIKNFKPYTLCGSRYILIEFSFRSATEEDVSAWCGYLLKNGVVPIIAHPERYMFVWEDPTCLDRLSDMGVLFQINAGSPMGMFGEETQDISISMINKGFVDFVGSDAHDSDYRNTDMCECFESYGDDVSMELLYKAASENPKYIMEDEPYKPVRKAFFSGR